MQKTKRFGARALALAMVATAAGVIGSIGVAGAIPPAPQSITVNNEAEYRAALLTLSAGGGVEKPEGVAPEGAPVENTIVLAADITLTQSQDPVFSGGADLRIEGQGHTIDAAHKSRALLVVQGITEVTLDGVIVENGTSEGTGGGVFTSGDLTMESSTVRDSESTATAGGGVFAGGALVMEDSSLIGNSLPHGPNDLNHGGGASAGTIQATASTVSGNTADSGAGLYAYNIDLAGSTVSGNIAAGNRGYGAGLHGTNVTLDNSTVTGNSGVRVGGILATGSVTAILSTIAGNTTTTGPANLQALAGVSWSTFGSVIADPIGGSNCLIAGPTDSAFSYATDSSCNLVNRSDVQSGADPQLGELGDNGGTTETLLPGTASPLLDRIPSGTCEAHPIDQRGEPRPEAADTGCDVGSVEGSGDPAPAAQCFGQDVTVVIGEGDQPTEGTDVILGTEDDDVIDGLGGSDRICGLGGSDTLRGGSGLDYLSGGEGDDDLGGGIGPDTIQGNQGDDALFGANGIDSLVGGVDDDRLSGGAADDHLVGGANTDRCDGGAGTDTRQTCEVLVGFP